VDYLLVTVTAILASGVTLFSGFGLGTVLMPAFALFFPVPLAIAGTAIVHLASNLFKVALVGRQADRRIVVRFGLPAAVAAVAGASLLNVLSDLPVITIYELGAQTHEVTVIRVVIGIVIVAFALLELSPRFAELEFPPRYLTLGGLISGFFGGLSGNQGAFRSAFLIKSGLDKEAFIGTSVALAVVVDSVRLAVYGLTFYRESLAVLQSDIAGVVVAAIVAAFFGAYLGARLIQKVTLRAVRLTVAIAMIVVGGGLTIGLL